MSRGNPLHDTRGTTSSPSGSPEWSAQRHAIWDRRFFELLEFRRHQGHVNVPRNWPEHPRLATWVANQRRLIGAGEMDPARLLRLRQAGVVWEGMDARRDLHRATWDRMFATARAFHRTN